MSDSGAHATKRRWWIISAVGVAVMLALCIWYALTWQSDNITANQAGFSVKSDDLVTVSWDVVPSKKEPITCTLIALSDRRDVLGTKVVQLKKSPYNSTRYNADIRTTSRAVSATVKECHYTSDKGASS